jgi:SAM-dependent methyltransferase
LHSLYVGDYASERARKFGGFIERGRRAFVGALARRIARRTGARGRVLDIGCGDGKLLAALAARGFECTGTELNPRVREGLPAGIDVRVVTGGVTQAGLPAQAFDVVVLRHVLEHLPDPFETLHEVRRIIKPEGTLIIAVPNLASWQARRTREHWFHLDLPRHLYHFSPNTLGRALEHSGFRLERMSHFSFEQNPYGWLQSGLTAAGGRWSTLYDQLRLAQARRPEALVLAAAVAMMPVCVALGTLESLARAGGTIEAWARPR